MKYIEGFLAICMAICWLLYLPYLIIYGLWLVVYQVIN